MQTAEAETQMHECRRNAAFRRTGILLLTVCLLFGAAADAAFAALSGSDGTVRISAPSGIPFYFSGNREVPEGIMVDVWEKWGENAGLTPVFVPPIPANTAAAALDRKDVNILVLDERDARTLPGLLISPPFYETEYGIFYPKSDSGRPIFGLKDLNHLTAGVLRNTANTEILHRDYPEIHLKYFDDPKAMIQTAAKGGIRVMIGGIVPVKAALKSLEKEFRDTGTGRKPPEMEIVRTPELSSVWAACVSRNRPELFEAVRRGLDALELKEMQKIERRWISDAGDRFFSKWTSTLPLTPSELIWLKKHPRIRVTGPLAFPPFHFFNKEGKPGGMACNYIGIIEQHLGVTLDYQPPMPWAQVMEKAQKKEIDLIACAGRSQDRERFLYYSSPYLSFSLVIISRTDSHFLGGLKDLTGHRVAMIPKDVVNDWITTDNLAIRRVWVKTPLDALQAVSDGRADAYVANLASATYLMEKYGLNNLKVAAPTSFGNYNLYMPVRRDWQGLAGIIDKILTSISDEEHREIRQRWITVKMDSVIDPVYVRRRLMQMGAVVFTVILLLYLRNRQIRISEDRFRGLTEHGADMILAFSAKGVITYQGPSITQSLGYPRKKLVGRSIFSLIHKEDHDECQQHLMEIIREKAPVTYEHRIRHSEGHYVYVESRCANLLDRKSLNAIVMNSRDTTLRREQENALRLAKEAAESANHAKSIFLANVSHEIRTPLNAILGFSELLMKRIDDPMYHRHLESIFTSGRSLLALINDILDLSKIEAGKMEIHPEPVNVKELVNAVRYMYMRKFSEKGLELRVQIGKGMPEWLYLDDVRIRQILINLTTNALKNTDTGHVRISLEAAESGNRNAADSRIHLLMEVEDTGAGIPKNRQTRIFESFYQLDGDSRKQIGGTGLGLAITRRLAELMNGEIHLKSRLGLGSLFIVSIPDVRIADSRTVSEMNRMDADSDHLRFHPAEILLVDDVASNRELIITYFRDTDLTCTEAENGLQALEKLDHGGIKPDLILMDLRMPGMSGYEVTAAIREREALKTIPVIAVTASAMKDTEDRIRKMFDGYLRKPVSRHSLFTELRRFLSHSVERVDEDAPAFSLETLKGKTPEEIIRAADTAEKTILNKWTEIGDVYYIDQIEELAAELIRFGKREDMIPLMDFGEELKTNARLVNVEAMDRAGKDFPILLKQMKIYADSLIRTNAGQTTEKDRTRDETAS